MYSCGAALSLSKILIEIRKKDQNRVESTKTAAMKIKHIARKACDVGCMLW
jgi:hypothetical protein